MSKLVTPETQDAAKDARETAELMIEQSIAVQRAIADGDDYQRSHRGEEWDDGYAQGRKDACRVLMLSFDPHYRGPRSTDEEAS